MVVTSEALPTIPALLQKYHKIQQLSLLHVVYIWNDLSLNETDFSSFTSFKSPLTPYQLLQHCKVYFM